MIMVVMVIKDPLLIKSNGHVNSQVDMFDFTLVCAPGEITLAPCITGLSFYFIYFIFLNSLLSFLPRSLH